MHEFQLIQQFFDRQSADASVRIGIGDDGAVMTPQTGLELVNVIDTLVENVHFPANLAPDAIGFRAVAVNLSDMAAMGARPRWMTLALTLDDANESWLQGFAAGLFAAADEHGVSLVGGDTTRGKQKVVSIQISGDVTPGKVLCRSGATPGELLFVSGSIGDAAAGLALLRQHDVASDRNDYLQNRFKRPSARVRLGQALAGLASAAIDISDGLFSDVARLLDKSGVGGVLETSSIPLSGELRSYCGDAAALEYALAGGDDYELCFAVPVANAAAVNDLAEELGILLTCIGEVKAGQGLTCTSNGCKIDYVNEGYRHF